MTSTPPPVDPHIKAALESPAAKKPRGTRWIFVLGLGVPILGLVAYASYQAVSRANRIDRVIEMRAAQDKVELEKMNLREKTLDGTVNTADIDRMQAATNKAADSIEKSDPASAAVLREFVILSKAISVPVVEFSTEFQAAGALAPATLVDKEKLDARLAMLNRARPLAADAHAKTVRLYDDLAALCEKHGLNAAQRKPIMDGLPPERAAALSRIRELDVLIFKEMADYLTLLSVHFGKWSFDGENLVFESDETLKSFQEITGRMGTLAKEQTALMSKVQTPDRFLSKP